MFRNVIIPKLTELQKKYVSEFIKSLNPFESCKKAGYAEKNINSALTELLGSERVRAVIEHKIEESAQNLTPCKAFFVKKLLDIVNATTASEEVFDRSGNVTGKTKLADASVALRALEALSKYFPAEISDQNSDKNSDSGRGFLCIENLDTEKI